MQECFSIRRQTILKASECDYSEHDGFLLCLVCEEPVFLRKAHERNGYQVAEAFIHHKLSKFASTCELRSVVNKDLIHSQVTKQHYQTMQKLELSMWKLLKTNYSVDLKHWSNLLYECKTKTGTFKGLCEWCEDILQADLDIVWRCFKTITYDLRTKQLTLRNLPNSRLLAISKLCEQSTSTYWSRHINISWQAYKLLTCSPKFYSIRERLYGVLGHPSYMGANGITLDKWYADLEGTNSLFMAHLIGGIQYICLTVDWQALL